MALLDISSNWQTKRPVLTRLFLGQLFLELSCMVLGLTFLPFLLPFAPLNIVVFLFSVLGPSFLASMVAYDFTPRSILGFDRWYVQPALAVLLGRGIIFGASFLAGTATTCLLLAIVGAGIVLWNEYGRAYYNLGQAANHATQTFADGVSKLPSDAVGLAVTPQLASAEARYAIENLGDGESSLSSGAPAATPTSAAPSV